MVKPIAELTEAEARRATSVIARRIHGNASYESWDLAVHSVASAQPLATDIFNGASGEVDRALLKMQLEVVLGRVGVILRDDDADSADTVHFRVRPKVDHSVRRWPGAWTWPPAYSRIDPIVAVRIVPLIADPRGGSHWTGLQTKQ